jgi:hypothetical protein
VGIATLHTESQPFFPRNELKLTADTRVALKLSGFAYNSSSVDTRSSSHPILGSSVELAEVYSVQSQQPLPVPEQRGFRSRQRRTLVSSLLGFIAAIQKVIR